MTNFIKYAELLAGVTGIICYSKKKKSVWLFFAATLIILFGLEQIGQWLAQKELYSYNINLYKWIVIPFIFCVYHIVFFKISTKQVKPFVIWGLGTFILAVLMENTLLTKNHFYTVSASISVGCISVLIFSLLFFAEMMKSDLILSFDTNMSFWFCAAVFLFYIACFPYLAFYNSLAKAQYRNLYTIYRWIFIVLNYVMYLLLTIGFLWSKRR